MLTSLPGGQVGFLVFVNIFIFVMAFFLDFFEIAFIIIPLLTPAAQALNIDLVWFGVMICANMQTSFMHPPFGFALFYLRGIVPREQVKTSDIYWGAIPWVVLQLILVLVLIFWPGLVTSFIAPPNTTDLNTIQITLAARPERRSNGAPELRPRSAAKIQLGWRNKKARRKCRAFNQSAEARARPLAAGSS